MEMSEDQEGIRARAESLLRASSVVLKKSIPGVEASARATATTTSSGEGAGSGHEIPDPGAGRPTPLRAWQRFRSMLSAEQQKDVRRASSRLLVEMEGTGADENSGAGASSKVLNQIIELLALKDPRTGDYPRHWDGPGLHSCTADAICAIFFAGASATRPALLKHGGVLLGGERRELMLFTNGFLFNHGDWDAFTRREVRDYFRSMGKALNETALDKMLKKYDYHCDGTLSKRGFEEMLHDLLSHPKPERPDKRLSWWPSKPEPQDKGMSWWSLGHKIDIALAKTDIERKLHVAFQMADIEKIETIRTCKSNKPRAVADSECTQQALAVHIKGVKDPLMMTCAHNRDIDAWAEAFATCISSSSSGISSKVEGEELPGPLGEDGNAIVSEALNPTTEHDEPKSTNKSSGSQLFEEEKKDDDPGSTNKAFERKLTDEEQNAIESKALHPTTEHDEPKSTNKASENQLSEEEQNDNAAWRQRFIDGSVFDRDYVPRDRERKEMDAIAEFLALKNSTNDPANPEEPGQQVTKKAIDSIFFAEPIEPQSVLLKRGPVLLNGEERELAIFTHGFLFAHVELDSLASLLLVKDPTHEQLVERFHEIDVTQTCSLDPREVKDFFTGMGVPLNKPALDHIMTAYDLNSDGVISWNEFKAMMHEMKAHKQSEGLTWSSLGKKLRGRIGRASIAEMTSAAQKLDVAYQMMDIERVENLGICHSSKSRIFADSEWAHLTLAVHIKEKKTPILVTCAKPGHVEAWMEVFHACVSSIKSSVQSTQEGDTPGQEEFDPSKSGMITGFQEEHPPRKMNSRPSLQKWSLTYGSAVDWASSYFSSSEKSL